ncbi:putative ATPase [Rivularia sp. PCC 7116]|uniref:trifunctional serine/threonine-protein kinase/ATP-binding protein/sensor histidine kinase n=1 Tax=Rivularia sp. PCC 7116 TaxID=373994 RepID=UPI00029F0598|nr:ATP-binding sensor histidine kinase [Rivularia sp. PCC 7116]AFY53116.1 putative ATPase [Rivularia sp. PCC 7116]
MVGISGYQILEQLYNGSRTLVYRAIREAEQKPVIIKILKNSHPDFNELLQLRNQYTIAKNLDIPEIVLPYSLEPHQNSYALVMEDFGGVSLYEYMVGGNVASLEDVLSITVKISNILYNLHQNRVIHKDIKPANILINPSTKEVKLIDFSIASLLPKETQQIKNPNGLEGTLAYLSPEQTGRMNRGVDFRADFYALGVTLFELLTGELPFKSDDAVELVHCHIAKTPPSINKPHPNPLLAKERGQETNKTHSNLLLLKEMGLEIPQVLSDIVMKLMAKNAEDRYQSALGLKHDLEKCLYQLKETGKIENFEIAQADICDRFIIPEKLYGRETEVGQLLAAFDRVSNGNRELMLISGFSGIGKTAVINEVHKPIVKQRGYFIKGKFDQFNRSIPLDAFVQAFRDLMGQLLSENDAQLSNWKHKILKALGGSAQVIIDVIPKLEEIIGKQPPVTELSGTAAQNRFNLLFKNFIQVFTTKEHPLVVFLDDLQWADSASLNLMQRLMSESESGYLLLIGAYRNNEVFPAHPLMLTLEKIAKSSAIVNTITLTPLKQESLNELVAETLNCLPLSAQPLTQLVYQKTQGNPFFSTQFLKALYEDSLIKFDFDAGSWVCNIAEVRTLALTHDVVEFMALQLQRLPESTQNILKLAACIGNKFDLSTLAIVCQKSETETATNLWKALQLGLILPQSEVYKFYLEFETNTSLIPEQIINYKFLHDRVQQAAYSLIPDNQKQKTHYDIGQLLLQQTSPEAIEERIFEIVNQLNYGTGLITEQKQRTELAKLNLIACRKARSATAYQMGREYVSIGLSLLEDAWQSQYEISLEFHDLGAELASLCGNFQEMENFVDAVIAKANSLLEKVYVYRIRIQANLLQNKLSEAISIGKQILQQLGITFPDTPTEEDIQNSIAVIEKLTKDREIEDLVNLPIMADAEKIAILQIAISIVIPAYRSGSTLLPLLISLSIKLSIQYGNTEASAEAYSCYSIIACNMLQDVETAVKFGDLALELAFKLDAKTVKPEMLNVVSFFIIHRKSHIKKTLPLAEEGYRLALEVGHLEFVGYNTSTYCLHAFWCSQPLVALEREIRAYCNVLVQLNQLSAVNWCRIYLQSILNLLGFAKHPSILLGEALEEAEFLPKLIEANDLNGLVYFYLYKLMLCYLFGDIESAKNHAFEVKRYLVSLTGSVCEPAFYLYDSLVILAALTQSEETSELLERVEQNQTQLQAHWAKYAPMNYQHKVDLVAAEKYRILGKKAEAIELYDKAISGAKANEYIQEEALSNELAAKFYLDWGKEKVASGYMQEAYYCYARWGAKAKTDDLEKRYPQLLTAILETQQNNLGLNETFSSSVNKSFILNQTIQTNRNSTSVDEALDFASILKASQALSSEIQLEQLISKLMQVVMENAGAKKAALILLNEDTSTLMLKAVASSCESIKLINLPYQDSQEIPTTIINHVKRNQKIIVLDDATQNSDFIADSYLIQQQPLSLLCMPIWNQGKIIGLLYLENSLTTGAFTQNRVEILNLLCTQAAISLENAQLYSKLENYSHTLEEKVEQRTQEVRQTLKELQQTQAQLIQNEKMSSLGQLVAGIAHEINNPISFIYGNLKPASEYTLDLIELIDLYQNLYPQSLPEIESKIEYIDLDYLIEDLPKLLNSMQTGAQRIREIVLSLRNFSRLDEAELKPVDVHSGINSTLLILQQKFTSYDKYPEIEVIKNYSKLPEVNCYASELNQVFLNIIGNAIDALRDKQENQPKITISTSFKDNKNILISIKDNGIGISEAALNKIFDPFFTTKPVGSGTGLGLSTSYSIVVEKHQGNLSCVSAPEEGTEFLIELPIQP